MRFGDSELNRVLGRANFKAADFLDRESFKHVWMFYPAQGAVILIPTEDWKKDFRNVEAFPAPTFKELLDVILAYEYVMDISYSMVNREWSLTCEVPGEDGVGLEFYEKKHGEDPVLLMLGLMQERNIK